MKKSRRRNWLSVSWLWACAVLLVIGSGCQLSPNISPAPLPFYPKEMFELIPGLQTAPEYSLADGVTPQTPNNGPKALAK